MGNDLRTTCDGILQRTATGVPGVVAMITDRSGNIYEGAAGKRSLGGSQPMTTDSVFAIYSTSKAITGTAALEHGAQISIGDIRLCFTLEAGQDRTPQALTPLEEPHLVAVSSTDSNATSLHSRLTSS